MSIGLIKSIYRSCKTLLAWSKGLPDCQTNPEGHAPNPSVSDRIKAWDKVSDERGRECNIR